MFNTIFSKQFTLYLCTLILSFAVLGAILSQVISAYLTEMRVSALKESAEKIAIEMAALFQTGIFDDQEIMRRTMLANSYLNAGLILLNHELGIFYASDIKFNQNAKMDFEPLSPLKRGETVEYRGNLNGAFQDSNIIVGQPIRTAHGVIASVLLVSPVSDLDATIWDMYKIVALCLLFANVLGFALIFVLSRTISTPLRQMNQVAKQISSGDFEKRLPVKGRDEVSQLAQSLNNMAESLDQQEKNRRDFIANISHDLRSPLTSIRGFIQAIMDGAVPQERINHYLGIVLDESERLSKLANDIVDLSQIEAQKIQVNKMVFDINSLIRETALLFERRILQKKLRMMLEFADTENNVHADQEKIKRVVYNLLDNAIKFTPENGVITAETSLKEGRVWVTVRDTGIGISASDQKHIFDRFYKADPSRGEDKKGNGLGLSIVKEFTKAHGSTVILESEPGNGAAFRFSLEPG